MEHSENKEIGHPLSTKETAEKMGELYIKGFGATVIGIYLKCRILAEELEEEERSSREEKLEKSLDKLRSYYDKLDEDVINQVAPTLNGMKEILNRLEAEARSCKENPSQELANGIFETAKP